MKFQKTTQAGEALSELIRGLMKAGLNLRNLVIVGHSLGALLLLFMFFALIYTVEIILIVLLNTIRCTHCWFSR